jgi:hypothetical protein
MRMSKEMDEMYNGEYESAGYYECQQCGKVGCFADRKFNSKETSYKIAAWSVFIFVGLVMLLGLVSVILEVVK